MADPIVEWIRADDALDLVRTHIHGGNAARAICERAHAGLIKARAKLFIRPERQAYGDPRDTEYPEADIPSEFWWAKGGGALNANWVSGDFDTWIDRRLHWRAFGVVFDRDGINGLLPPMQSPSNPISWDDWPLESAPELQRMTDIASRDEWWTWPEAIAWVGSRDPKNIATLRYWALEWSKHTAADEKQIAQHWIANQFNALSFDPKEDLHSAIERGAVRTIGRTARDGVAGELPKEVWRGGAVVFSDGAAQLVSAKTKLTVWAFDIFVCRADLVETFPSTAGDEGQLTICKSDAPPSSAPIGLKSFNDQERRAWMMDQSLMSADKAFDLYRKEPRHCRMKRPEFRSEWKKVKGTQQGRQPKSQIAK